MTDLIYPTLDLFLYDLRNGLGDNESEISARRQQYQKKLPETVYETLFEVDNDFDTEYRELLPKSKIKKFETSRESDPLTGYYYPVRLGDTYGLLVDCSVENQTDPQPAKCVAELKQEIEQNQLKGEKANIGQTWMISGWMPPSREKTPQDVAIASYKSLISEGNWEEDLEGQGKFMGADIFELSRYRLVIKEKNSGEVNIQNIQQNLHIIIIIYPNIKTAKKAANFYFEWMQLFVYRHKILWCYGQSRLLKQSIKNYFSTIEDQQKLIKLNTGLNLEILADLLRDVQILLNNYTIDLNRLEFQSSTIDINLSNYQKRWSRIAEKARRSALPEFANNQNDQNDLMFLEIFSELVTDKYQFQIHKDIENLERGQKLLENIINAARSRVEVEKADRDQKFQDLITILGVGWAAGSFVKDYKSETENPELTSFPEILVANYITPLMYPLSVAILVALLTGWVKNLCDRSDFFARVFGLLIGKVGKK